MQATGSAVHLDRCYSYSEGSIETPYLFSLCMPFRHAWQGSNACFGLSCLEAFVHCILDFFTSSALW